MNRILGLIGSAIVGLAVIAFAVSMMIGQPYFSYATSLILSWGYVLLAGSFSAIATADRKAAAQAGTSFAVLYCGFATAVYFVQLTTVLHHTASVEILNMLDYQALGSVMFNLELLGYGLMALSTFFTGLTIATPDKISLWLKILLLAHGVFAPVCVVLPILNVFGTMSRESGAVIGVTMSFAWCAYFVPVCILAFVYFRRQPRPTTPNETAI